MIQSVLLFSLGFLCAGFLALMVSPAIWRRAVLLTRRRIEASVPLTLNEIQADKDRMRAEFAMSTRRLEMSVKAFRDKASAQVAEINRNREELKRLGVDRDEKTAVITDLETKASALRKELGAREHQLEETHVQLEDVQQKLETKAYELEHMRERTEELVVTSSNRQVELVSREAQVEKLAGDVDALRLARRETEAMAREREAEAKTALETLNQEKKRLATAEKKLDRLIASLADREEKLDRREKELARLREELKENRALIDNSTNMAANAEKQKVKLESELASMTLQMSTLLEGAKGGDIEKAMKMLTKDRERVAAQLASAEALNGELVEQVDAFERAKTSEWDDQKRENAILREQINDLAAEVVTLTASLEGPDSPILKALADKPGEPAARTSGNSVISLADRVRALQHAAAAKAE